jgi:hypothetical protein
MANLRYQQPQIQQTEKGAEKLKNEKRQRCLCFRVVLGSNAGFACDLPSP